MTYDEYAHLKGWHLSDFSTCPPGESAYYTAELARHGFCCQGRRILELGFGNGLFLRFARDSGADIVGVEIQDELLRTAEDKGFVVYRSLDHVLEVELEHSFDLAVAFDVIEHLSPKEAVEVLQKMHRLIKQDTGLFIARFPNGDSPFSLPIQNGDYTHKVAIGGGMIAQILGRSGWRINYLGEPVVFWDTFKDRVLHGGLYFLRRCFERLILTLYYGRRGPSTLFYNYILAASPNSPGPASERRQASQPSRTSSV
jgi:SAM-dependent methyltransferase